MKFLDELRNELIESGETTKTMLDYIDGRIDEAITNKLTQGFSDVEEHILEQVKELGGRR